MSACKFLTEKINLNQFVKFIRINLNIGLLTLILVDIVTQSRHFVREIH
jgi:diphthamide biosynthesis methyltransferase